MASMTSDEVIGMVRGRPAMRSRPRTSIDSSRSSGSAVPIVILTSSAVRSPIIRLYFLRMYEVIASSNRFPPTRSDVETTIPPRAMTATSLVPPPMSMTMFPDGPRDRDVGADRRRERLLDQVRLARAGLERRVLDRALLDRGHARRHRDHHRRAAERSRIRPLIALLMKNRSIASVMT